MILQLLEWDLCPLTPAGWLRMYLQIACQQLDEGKSQSRFDMPRFSIKSLCMVSRLLDLATLDAGCMAFSYATLAASAFALIYGRENAVNATGFRWPQIKICVAWMARYAITLHTQGLVVIAGTEEMNEVEEDAPLRPELKFSPTIHTDNDHNLQNHVITLKMLVNIHPLCRAYFFKSRCLCLFSWLKLTKKKKIKYFLLFCCHY